MLIYSGSTLAVLKLCVPSSYVGFRDLIPKIQHVYSPSHCGSLILAEGEESISLLISVSRRKGRRTKGARYHLKAQGINLRLTHGLSSDQAFWYFLFRQNLCEDLVGSQELTNES